MSARGIDTQHGRSPSPGTRPWAGLAALFVAALGVRLLYLHDAWRSPFTPRLYLPIDAGEYQRQALALLAGTWPPAEPFFRPPLYACFVAAVYRVAGESPLAVLLIQAVLGAGSCLLAYGIARALFRDGRVATLAGWICAGYGTLVYFDAQMLSGSLDVFLQLAVLRLLLAASDRPGMLRWWAAGAAMALSALLRGGILLLLPLLLLWLALLARGAAGPPAPARPGRFVVLRGLALLVPVGLAVAPVAWHNARFDRPGSAAPAAETLRRLVSGEFVLVASNSGINFYLGNHGALRSLNRLDDPDHIAVYERIAREPARHGVESTAAANRYLVDETLRHVAEWPGEWLRLLLDKGLEVVNGTEIPRNTSLYADRADSPTLRLLLWRALVAFPTGVVLPFAFVGLWLARRDWRRHFVVWASLAAQAAFLLGFFVTARYRLPMLPLLAVYAAAALVELLERWRSGARRPAARLLGTAAALLVPCNLPIVPVSDTHHWVDHFNLGIALVQSGDLAGAEAQLRAAAALNPTDERVRRATCQILRQRGHTVEAEPWCEPAPLASPLPGGSTLPGGSPRP